MEENISRNTSQGLRYLRRAPEDRANVLIERTVTQVVVKVVEEVALEEEEEQGEARNGDGNAGIEMDVPQAIEQDRDSGKDSITPPPVGVRLNV